MTPLKQLAEKYYAVLFLNISGNVECSAFGFLYPRFESKAESFPIPFWSVPLPRVNSFKISYRLCFTAFTCTRRTEVSANPMGSGSF